MERHDENPVDAQARAIKVSKESADGPVVGESMDPHMLR